MHAWRRWNSAMRNVLYAGAVLISLMTVANCPIGAQAIHGLVVDDLTDAPLGGTLVVLLDTAGLGFTRVESDSLGRFRIHLRGPGRFSIWASRIGYEQLASDLLRFDKETTPIEIRMTPVPVSLDPLQITAESRRIRLDDMGFYARKELGIGRFIVHEDFESRASIRLTDVLRTEPSVRVLNDPASGGGTGSALVFRAAVRGLIEGKGGRPCLPTLVLDGVEVRDSGSLPGPDALPGTERPIRLDELVHPSEIAGLELYPSGAGVPARWAGLNAACGVILIWTHRR